jgi:hypothetical protein
LFSLQCCHRPFNVVGQSRSPWQLRALPKP